MTLITDEMLDNGDQHASASKRREIALRYQIAELETALKFRDALFCLLLRDRGGSATYPVQTLTDTLGNKPDSAFNDDKTEIISAPRFAATPRNGGRGKPSKGRS